MSGGERGVYSIDTSSLMDWHDRYYPVDVFPGLRERLEELAAEGRLVAAALVREEVEKVGTRALGDWAAGRKGIFVATDLILRDALEIQDRFAGLRDPRAEYEEADAYVIALARQRAGVVVTQETAAGEKRNPKRTQYIPDVCRALCVDCIGLLGLLRREGWRF